MSFCHYGLESRTGFPKFSTKVPNTYNWTNRHLTGGSRPDQTVMPFATAAGVMNT